MGACLAGTVGLSCCSFIFPSCIIPDAAGSRWGNEIIWKHGRFALIIEIPGVILNKRQNHVGRWPVPFCLEEKVRSQANCPAGD